MIFHCIMTVTEMINDKVLVNMVNNSFGLHKLYMTDPNNSKASMG